MGPFLLIDVGNTRTKWAQAAPDGRVRPLGDMATRELTHTAARSLAHELKHPRVLIASVVPSTTARLKKAVGRRAVFLSDRNCGLRFRYPHPGEIGADRLACAAAVDGPAIILACGTATVASVLDREGAFCGGVIAPGLEAQLASLVAATAQLPTIALRPSTRALGRSTGEAIRHGVILNFQGGAREIVRRLRGERTVENPRLILTGGNAAYLKGVDLGPCALRPLLALEGLGIIAHRLFRA